MDSGHKKRWCERLYESKAASLILYARSLGLSHTEAEDVLQETFRALLELDRPPKESDRYVLRAVRNRALNYRRSLMRRLRREAESRDWFETRDDPRDQESEAMERLAELPREQREVIVLKIWSRHSFETIGEVLGISPNTAAARYRYGLQKLRAAMPNPEDEAYEGTGTRPDRGPVAPVETTQSVSTSCATGFPSPAVG